MKKLLLLILVFSLFINCKNQESNLNQKNTDTETISQDCIPYFDFDEVEYYHNDISDRSFFNLNDSEESKDTLLFSILNKETLSKLSDTIYIKYLNNLGYKKATVDTKDFSGIQQVFCERTHKTMTERACETIYRSILIFKKENKINGIAKICFGCQKSSIAGTNRNTIGFGQSGDFEKLNDLLSKYRK